MSRLRLWLSRRMVAVWLRFLRRHGNGLTCVTPCPTCARVTEEVNWWTFWGDGITLRRQP